jgi:hypothetical protein
VERRQLESDKGRGDWDSEGAFPLEEALTFSKTSARISIAKEILGSTDTAEERG